MTTMPNEDNAQSSTLDILNFVPTDDQRHALATFYDFMSCPNERSAMLLRGSAGTGKTTIAATIVKTLLRAGRKVMLLAPTGRAAKVFSLYAKCEAFTIHRKIYRQKVFAGDFNLNDNLHKDTLFIVDEASMIANQGYENAMFGSGCLLDDLVQFVYQGHGCRLLLIGDKAQLPPVGEDESPALNAAFMAGYGLKIFECDLDEVVRQSEESGILFNATRLRRLITRDALTQLPRIRLSGFADVRRVTGAELIEEIASSYHEVGADETIVVTRSNKRANIFNRGIRNTVLAYEDLLSSGDMLMVVKNNYYWSEKEKLSISFLANGDRARVSRVRRHRELYGFHFADVLLTLPDYDDAELEATVLLETLEAEAPALTRDQNDQLFQQVMEDYADIRLKSERIKMLRSDPHYNALQIKFGYAVTCHKAQGGQWAHVYLDQGYVTEENLTPDYIHWLYTAFTRATERLYLINWPEKQEETD